MMYPSKPVNGGLKDTVTRYFDPSTSAFKTQFEIDEEDAAEAQKELEETYEKPYFTIKSEYITPDLYGDKYLKCPHAEPCPELDPPVAFVQLDS